MRKLFLFVLLLSTTIISKSQTTGWVWARNASVAGCNVSGSTTNSLGYTYVTGIFTDTVIKFGSIKLRTSSNNPEESNVYLVKYDSSGNAIWATNSNGNNANDGSVISDNVGNAYIFGNFYDSSLTFGSYKLNSGKSLYNIYFVKYSSSGNVIWAKSFSAKTISNNGLIVKGIYDNLGGIYLTGYFNDTISFDNITLTNDTTTGSADIFVVKCDTAGNVLWAKSFGGSKNDEPTSITADAAGNIYFGGNFDSPYIIFGSDTLFNYPNDYAAFIVKCDNNGNVIWAKDAVENNFISVNAITCDAFGHIYAAGRFNSPIIIFDSDTLVNIGYANSFFVKYNSNGNVLWAKSPEAINASLNNAAASITTTPSGNLFIAGIYTAPLAFDSITVYHNGNGSFAIYTVEYDSNANVLWAYGAGGTDLDADDYPTSLTSDNSGNVYMAGTFSNDSIIFGNNILINNFIAPTYDAFLAKIGEVPTGINQVSKIYNNAVVYPNPNNGNFNIKIPNKLQSPRIDIYNLLGIKIYTSIIFSSNYQVNIKNYSSGIYLYRIYNESGQFIYDGKIIIE